MRQGLTIANHGAYADPGWLAEVGVAAEEAGWSGVFVWDHIGRTGQPPMTDPWIALAAVAVATQRVRLGTMVTPLPRRRPWKVAREVTTLDHLSDGRVVLGVGLGNHPVEFDALGEETDLRRRAEMLEESLALLRAFWSGQSVTHHGTHYRVDGVEHQPTPVQARVPIWVAGRWPNQRPMRRAARFDGAFPITEGEMTPEDFLAVRDLIEPLRSDDDGPFDYVHEGTSRAGASLADHARVGVTWWLERLRPEHRDRTAALARVAAGPNPA